METTENHFEGTGSPTAVMTLAGILVLALALPILGQASRPAGEVQNRIRSGHAPAKARGKAQTQPASRPEEDLGDIALQDDSLGDLQLMQLEIPTVVTAGRREQKINTVPYAMSVITKEDIRWAGARNVTDALRLVPGMDVADISYGAAAVAPRGQNTFVSRTSLVLVDGRQIFDSLYGGTSWGSWPFQLEDIERIEVIRGPAGVTWGANAVSGVINIITRDPAEQQGLTVTGGGGSQGTTKEHAGYGITAGKLRLRVSSEYEHSDGFTRGGTWLRGLDDEYNAGRFNLHAIYEATPNDTFTLSGGNAITKNSLPPPPLAVLTPTASNGSQASFILGRWEHRIAADNRVQVTGYVNDYWVCPGVSQIDYRYEQFALQLTHTFKPAEDHTLTWGFDGRNDILDAGNSDPPLLGKDFVSTAILGLYLQDEWRFAPKWALTLGGRIDYEFYGGFQPSARASLSYELDRNSMVYGAVSRAFQMPPAGLRFADAPMIGGLAHLTSDQDLRPATLVSYETGYRSRLFDRLDLNLNLFCNQINDGCVQRVELGPPGLFKRNLCNGADILTYGAEWENRYAVSDRLTLLGNYTLELTDWQSPYSMHNADVMPAPKHKFMLGARYSPIQSLRLSSHLYYVDATRAPDPANLFLSRHIDRYFRWDLRAEYEFWKGRGSVAVGVRNTLDPDHLEGGTSFLNSAEVPRMLYGEMRIRLDR